MSDVLKRNTPYRRGDCLTLEERQRFNVSTPQEQSKIMAVWTGEKRFPKKGEWYLSGAIIEAYLAPNDLTIEFRIAKLVRVVRREVFDFVEE